MREERSPPLSVDSIAAIRSQIHFHEPPPGEDEYGLAETYEHIAMRRNEPITQANAMHNTTIRPRVPDFFLQPQRRIIMTSPETDYEHIFETPGLSRRSSRSFLALGEHHPEELICQGMMGIWYNHLLNRPNEEYPADLIMDLAKYSEDLLVFLPKKLTWNTNHILGLTFRDMVDMGSREAVWFRDGRTGREWRALPFLGIAVPGHLVLRADNGWQLADDGVTALPDYEKIRQNLVRAEQALILLAREVAAWVVKKIVYEFMVPESVRQGRNVLDLKQITGAVREILGEEWFDLPFDPEGDLLRCTAAEVFEPGSEIEVKHDGGVRVRTPGRSWETTVRREEEREMMPDEQDMVPRQDMDPLHQETVQEEEDVTMREQGIEAEERLAETVEEAQPLMQLPPMQQLTTYTMNQLAVRWISMEGYGEPQLAHNSPLFQVGHGSSEHRRLAEQAFAFQPAQNAPDLRVGHGMREYGGVTAGYTEHGYGFQPVSNPLHPLGTDDMHWYEATRAVSVEDLVASQEFRSPSHLAYTTESPDLRTFTQHWFFHNYQLHSGPAHQMSETPHGMAMPGHDISHLHTADFYQYPESGEQAQPAPTFPSWASMVLERNGLEGEEIADSPGERAAGFEDYEGEDAE